MHGHAIYRESIVLTCTCARTWSYISTSCSRVLVMDAGQVKEYAAPSELLADDTSIFFSMARDAGLVAWVYVHPAHHFQIVCTLHIAPFPSSPSFDETDVWMNLGHTMMTSFHGKAFRVSGPLWEDSPDRGPATRASMFSSMLAWTNSWINRRVSGDWRRYDAHCDVIVMISRTSVPLTKMSLHCVFVLLWCDKIMNCISMCFGTNLV